MRVLIRLIRVIIHGLGKSPLSLTPFGSVIFAVNAENGYDQVRMGKRSLWANDT